MKFETGFLIGAATAAHQVEGNNIHSDYWALEHMQHTIYHEPSLDAVDHYNRYEEDIRLLADAGLNAYRFGIEWARIEPEENRFVAEEIEHYRKVIACCKQNGIEPMVTLHHFSSPKWLIGKGGWEADTTPDDFARYVRYVMEHLGSELHYVCTINEANMGVEIEAIIKRHLRQMHAHTAKANDVDSSVQIGIDFKKMMAVTPEAAEETNAVFGVEKAEYFTSPRTAHGDAVVVAAHTAARAVIRELCPQIKLGLTLSLHDIQALPGGEALAEKDWDDEFVHYLPALAEDDFLGVQNYSRSIYNENGSMPVPEHAEVTQMNYEFYPEGLEHVLRKVAASFHGELFVTENGVATADDTRRIAFIDRALAGVQRCRDDGLPVNGYFYWSLLDNFEWQRGYSMTFGLIAVDRTTQIRSPKPSLRHLGTYYG